MSEAAGREGRSVRVGKGAREEEDGTKHNFIWTAPFQTSVCS